ncbi:DUF2173 family protein [Ectothiorhodospiraceae bacterium 2226]|nr:DUF2173 family protein [Ectothiorhodospiraceae bacterium 2226]
MRLISELIEEPGVRLAADYPYRGDRTSIEGDMPRENVDLLAVVCRSNTTAVRMESDILSLLAGGPDKFPPFRGWMAHGANYSLCVVSNTLVLCNNEQASFTRVVRRMLTGLHDAPDERI